MFRCRQARLTLLLVAVAFLSFEKRSSGDDPPKADNRLSVEAARNLKSPVPYSKDSIARGRTIYIRDCSECHGTDGKSQLDIVANATDLTDPRAWVSGISEGEVFRSIRDGAGDGMPPFKDRVEDNDMWHMVNFIRSLWPADKRPKLEESEKS